MLGTETSLKGLSSATSTGPASFATSNKAGRNTVPRTVNGAIAEYKRQHCAAMGIGIGPRLHSECPFGVTADQFSPSDSEALQRVIASAYRQVLGNLPPTESQRETSLEARLLNGEISVRDFVNGLAKSDFYKKNFFHAVGAQRGIELNFKHLLGRAPLNQAEVQAHIKLQAEEGFDALVDSLTNSAEYTEVFGADIVPYERTKVSTQECSPLLQPDARVQGNEVAVSDNAQGCNRTVNRGHILERAQNHSRSLTLWVVSPSNCQNKILVKTPK